MISLRKNVNDVFGLECKRCYQVVPLPLSHKGEGISEPYTFFFINPLGFCHTLPCLAINLSASAGPQLPASYS